MNVNKSILVVDDEPGMRAGLAANFEHEGWSVETASGVAEATRRISAKTFSAVVTDVRMPDGDGLRFMRQVRNMCPKTAVIVLTAYGSVPEAVGAMQEGACHYFTKPVPFPILHEHLLRICSAAGDAKLTQRDERTSILGNSPILLRTLERARHAARANADVLVEAESGTGKELLARYIHNSSDRRDKPFIAVNCSAVPEHLLESELFGHVRGAFTGATQNRTGKFAAADGGTILLDEIGEMPLALQPKLLRVLQERQVEPLGESRSISVDIRVIATTNVSLLKMVGQGKFRADLYYRLNVIPISLPPLRMRKEDVPLLAQHFVAVYSDQAKKRAPRISDSLLNRMMQHEWPGNIRELSNLMRRAVTLSDTAELDETWLIADTPLVPLSSASINLPPASPGTSLRDIERHLLEKTLEATRGNRTRAAELLGISLRTVRNRIREYGLPPRSFALR